MSLTLHWHPQCLYLSPYLFFSLLLYMVTFTSLLPFHMLSLFSFHSPSSYSQFYISLSPSFCCVLFTTLYVSLSVSCPPSIPLATLIRFLIPILSTHSHISVCFCLSFYQLLFLSQPTLTSPCLLKLIRPWRIGVEISSFSLNCIILLYLLNNTLYM